jgi:hypothetical protein
LGSVRVDQTVVKMLVAAGKGAWQARIQWKGKADAALAAGEWSRAIECYQQALRGAADTRCPCCRCDSALVATRRKVQLRPVREYALIAACCSRAGNDGGQPSLPDPAGDPTG